MDASFQLIHCSWQDDSDALSSVRRIVFIEEQQVPEALELDELDPVCHHVLVADADNKPVATGRIDSDGRIGRMAVLKEYRGQGIGSALLVALLDYLNFLRQGLVVYFVVFCIVFQQFCMMLG